MAGAGYKLFNTGDVLTAAQVNNYLQEQTVMVFASAAARTTALSGVLAQGMMSYLQDTKAVQVYNGTSWVNVGGSSPLTTKGDLYTYSTADARLGVGSNNQQLLADSTAATGLKWAASPTSTLTTTGDLLYASSANTLARLGIGTSGQVLTVSGGVPAWAAAAGGGKVLQVVSATSTTEASSSSTTWVTTNLSTSITPAATTSRILILCNTTVGRTGAASANRPSFRLQRGATTVMTHINALYPDAQTFEMITGYSAIYLDSPSTTSSTTYTLEFRNEGGGTRVFVQNNSNTGSIILMEIGA